MIGKTISHYHILEELGRGGMGVVYKAQDTKLDRLVAIKFLTTHSSNDEENNARFLQEAKAAASLNHPNILSIYEIDKDDKNQFIVMEFIEGDVLRSLLKSVQNISLDRAIDFVTQTAKGLKVAHDKNIIHRDIKSENLMVTKDGQVKIMDFGIAKLKGSSGLTKTGMSVGTISYMSPEQVQGVGVDQRSDIWSLGVVFYELLTGELPFKTEHDAALIYMISNEDITPPSSLDRKIPNQIDTIVKKMLDKDWALRYQNLNDFIKDIEAVKKELEKSLQKDKKKAIAVLPFDNISPDKESDYFSDGLTDEIIANLARLKDMRVISRTTSIQYKKTNKDIKTIGRELGTR